MQISRDDEDLHTWGMENMQADTLVEIAGFGFDDEEDTEVDNRIFEIDSDVEKIEVIRNAVMNQPPN